MQKTIHKNSLTQFRVQLTDSDINNINNHLILSEKRHQEVSGNLLSDTNNFSFMNAKIDHLSLVETKMWKTLLEINESLAELRKSFITTKLGLVKNELIVFLNDIYLEENQTGTNFLFEAFRLELYSIVTINVLNYNNIVFHFRKKDDNTIQMTIIEVSKGIFDFDIITTNSGFYAYYVENSKECFVSTEKRQKVAYEIFNQYGNKVLSSFNKICEKKVNNVNNTGNFKTVLFNPSVINDNGDVLNLSNLNETNNKRSHVSKNILQKNIKRKSHCRKGFWRTLKSGKQIWVNPCVIHSDEFHNEVNSGKFAI